MQKTAIPLDRQSHFEPNGVVLSVDTDAVVDPALQDAVLRQAMGRRLHCRAFDDEAGNGERLRRLFRAGLVGEGSAAERCERRAEEERRNRGCRSNGR